MIFYRFMNNYNDGKILHRRERTNTTLLRRIFSMDKQKIDKQQNHQSGPEDPQLLTDNGKNHVIEGLRNPKLLDAVA